MPRRKTTEELAFPVKRVPSLTTPALPKENQNVIRHMIRAAVKGAFGLKTPQQYYHYGQVQEKKQEPIVSNSQVEFVTHLIESLEPRNAIEVALASQFAIAYIRGLDQSEGTYANDLSLTIQLFEFSHQVLETLTKYRTKGAQLINVQYNHNSGQINNVNINKTETPQPTIEVC